MGTPVFVVKTKFSLPPHPAPFKTTATLLTDKSKLKVNENELAGVGAKLSNPQHIYAGIPAKFI